jgi:transglutaminase/protease-like cytokinesis protein 3
MGKFLQMMSQNDSKALVARASQINMQASIAQANIVQKLKNDIAEVEIEIQNLTDFAPDTTQSLRPGVKGWQPAKWASDLQDAKTRLYELNIELKIAEATQKEFFGDDEDAALAPTED